MDQLAPSVDGRTYQQLLDEAVARIPVHNPEWTNRNEADPGITLLQLWAFMSESVLYRASLIPERNRLAFLRLLGYARRPARAATGIVTFRNARGPLSAPLVPEDTELAAGRVPFRTQTGLQVQPVEGKAFLKRRAALGAEDREEVAREYEALYASFADPGVDFDYYETTEVDWAAAEKEPVDLAGTVDGTLWLALLARPGDAVDAVRSAMAGAVVAVGVVPDVTSRRRVLRAGGADPLLASPGLDFAVPNVADPLPEQPEGRVATYLPVPARGSSDVNAAAGVLELDLPDRSRLGMWTLDPTEDGVGAFPPALVGDDADRLVTWLRVRPAPRTEGAGPTDATPVRLRWLGVNAATVRQRARVRQELLGQGTGGADQQVQLANLPVLPESLRLTVGGVLWRAVEDLALAAPEVALVDGSKTRLADEVERVDVFTLDPQSGVIRFGDGLRGRRPPKGAVVSASYDYGGGLAGHVEVGAIARGTGLPAGVSVANPVATWGGSEAQTVDDAEREIAALVRHRDRLVTPSDYEEVVRRAPGIDLGRVEVLPLFSPSVPDVPAAGVVTLVLLPRHDPDHPDTPEPDRLFLDAACAHLDPRRLVTTELHLRGPEYVPVWLSVGIEVLPGRELAVVREAVRAGVRTFLGALTGGTEGGGWPLSTDLERLEAWAVTARVRGVAKVTGVLLSGLDGVEVDRVPLSGLQLPRLVGLAVRQGTPQALEELRGAVADDAGPSVLPIPFVPAEC